MTGMEAVYTICILMTLASVMAGLAKLKKALKRYSRKLCAGKLSS